MLPSSPATTSCDDIYFAVLCRPGCQVNSITEIMQSLEWVQYSEWAVSSIGDINAWLSSVFYFASLGPESGPGEDYIWRTTMTDKIDGISRRNSLEPKTMTQETKRLIRKIMRQEYTVCNFLTKAQIEFLGKGPFSLSARQPNLETLDNQFMYIVRHLPEVIESADYGRTLLRRPKACLASATPRYKPVTGKSTVGFETADHPTTTR